MLWPLLRIEFGILSRSKDLEDFAASDVSVKHATDNLDWKEIVSPSVRQLLAEKISAMEKEISLCKSRL